MFLVFTSIALLTLLNLVDGGDTGSFGFCQVYSYNIKLHHSHLAEKHFFACCNNMDEKSCQAYTYQKPSKTSSFCSGEVVHQTGSSHWTQMETSAFPSNGHFYCGGCCGQHLAMEACNKQYGDSTKPRCMNWVQCFQKQCRSVVAAVLANQPLKCSLPPPPFKQHYRVDPRTVPASLNRTAPTASAPIVSPASFNATCTRQWCNTLETAAKCRASCCQQYCCLPDGEITAGQNHVFWSRTTSQVVGIAVGTVVFIVAAVSVVTLAAKRCVPRCRNSVKVPTHDTQILVVEGPEDGDSDAESV